MSDKNLTELFEEGLNVANQLMSVFGEENSVEMAEISYKKTKKQCIIITIILMIICGVILYFHFH